MTTPTERVLTPTEAKQLGEWFAFKFQKADLRRELETAGWTTFSECMGGSGDNIRFTYTRGGLIHPEHSRPLTPPVGLPAPWILGATR